MTALTIAGARSVISFPGRGPVRGEGFASVEVLHDASVACEGDTIEALGAGPDAPTIFDATGCTVIPGFVDCHTHLPFHGWRADEDAARLSGIRYESLHREEGGIFRSARMLAEAGDDAVLDFSSSLAAAMLRKGTTAFETKSGYGLTLEAELRQLRLARALAERVPQSVVSTVLAAHAVPKGRSQGEWVGEAANRLLPDVAE
ncbi:MAG: imidazolonepropionase, partial [Actinomycetota bacterium]